MGESSLESDSLHKLYRICEAPLKLTECTERLLDAGANVNSNDEKGWTPLSSLILHVNRGLRWHPHRIPGMETLEELNGNRGELEERMIEADNDYQHQVKHCLRLLLDSGANTTLEIPRVPAVIHSHDWIETFEHKLIQTEFRWNLLFSSSMEFSTYNAFNPLTKYCVPNSCDITLLHMASWRGDADVIDMLLNHGCDARKSTVGGRTALHFLYLYCNKPDHLKQCTQLLLCHGVDVNSVDSRGLTALHVLLPHCLTKRSHVMYLANSFNRHGFYNRSYNAKNDHYRDEVIECVELLLDYGAQLDLKGRSALCTLLEAFENSLEGCDEAFQLKGHYLVPYQFSLRPVADVCLRLIQLGSQVNALDGRMNQTSLHKAVCCIRNLNLHSDLNPQEVLLECFNCFFHNRVSINSQDRHGRTALDHLIDFISSSVRSSLDVYLPILNAFFENGANVNAIDCTGGTCVHRLMNKSHLNLKHVHRLLALLLSAGANVSIADHEGKYPMNRYLSSHVFHHDPFHVTIDEGTMNSYLRTLSLLVGSMSRSAINVVIGSYKTSGFCGLICSSQCPVYQVLDQYHTQPTSMKELSRMVIRRSISQAFLPSCYELPLPSALIDHIRYSDIVC